MTPSKREKVCRPPSAKDLASAQARERVKHEARGRCMRCGEPGTAMAPERDRFVLLCRACNGKRAVGIREEKKAAAARQITMFEA